MRKPGVIVFVLIASACGAAPDRVLPDDPQVVRAQLDSMWARLTAAMVAGDTASLANFYTDSAYFAETGSPTLRGRSAILAATASVFVCCKYLESRQQIERMEVAGDRAIQFGSYRDIIQPTGNPPLFMYGRFDAVLERDSIKGWRISRLVVIRDSSVSR
jgi:ketosteroid isomerase-like protein